MAANRSSSEKLPMFEGHLEALEKVVGELEGDALSLEASIERYKEGVTHLAACRKILDAAEQRLAELVASPDGGVLEKPLRVGPEGLEDAGGAPGRVAAPSKRSPAKPAGGASSAGSAAPGTDDDLPF